MNNLSSFGVQELKTKEVKEIQGGWVLPAIALAIAVLNTDWDKAASDFSRGFHSR